MWEQLAGRGLEHLLLLGDQTLEADGVAVGILDAAAYRIRYRISCDANWNVRHFSVESLSGNARVELTRDASGWLDSNGRTQESLRGCTEIDIMATPFTNTLPIRRLGLRPGQSAEIAVVYVHIPDLEVSRANQVYTCLRWGSGGGVVRYESMSTGFRADLTVDADGLVTDYPGIFRQVWKKSGP